MPQVLEPQDTGCGELHIISLCVCSAQLLAHTYVSSRKPHPTYLVKHNDMAPWLDRCPCVLQDPEAVLVTPVVHDELHTQASTGGST
jgi:hypothetical protein